MKVSWRNNMKKLFAVLLAAVMLACLFTGCKDETEPVDPSGATEAPTEAIATEAPTEETRTADHSAWRVALLTEDGNISDQSVIQAIYEAGQAWCGEHGVAFTYYEPTEQGLEARFKERLEQIKAWKAAQDKNKER